MRNKTRALTGCGFDGHLLVGATSPEARAGDDHHLGLVSEPIQASGGQQGLTEQVGTLLAVLLNKLDTLYLLPVFLTVLGLTWFRESHRCYRRIAILMPVALGLAGLHVWRFGWPYLQMSLGLLATQSVFWALLAAAAVVLGVLLVVFYVALPATVPADQITGRRMSLRRLGWYVSPAGFVLSALGALSLFRRRPPEGSVLLLLLALGALGFNLAIPMVDHVFGIRRFVAVAIPGLLLFNAGGLEAVASWRPSGFSRAGLGVAVLLGGPMLVGQAISSQILIPHREFEGASAMLDRVGYSITRGSVVVFPGHDSLLGAFLGPSLWLGHDLEPLYASLPLRAEGWQSVQKEAREKGRRLYAIDERRPPVLPSTEAVALSRMAWQIPELEGSLQHFPRQISSFDFEFTIWQIGEGDGTVRYEPSALLTEIGKVVAEGKGVLLQGQGAPGYLCYGPYHEFRAGRYVARFVLVNRGTCSETAQLDVVHMASRPLARLSADLEPTDGLQAVELPFALESNEAEGALLDFRVLLSDGGKIGLPRVEIVPVTGAAISEEG